MLKKDLGKIGENIAGDFYQKLGWEILARNFYTRYGELDLILQKDKKILLVEVKTRLQQHFGFGEESVSSKKIRNLNYAWEIFKNKAKIDLSPDLEVCVVEIKDKKAQIRRFLI